jgi:hypothetical protein
MVILIVTLGLTVVITVGLTYGSRRWESVSKEMRVNLEAGRLPIAKKAFDPKELFGLPAPVQRYFQAVLRDGQLIVEAVDIEHSGTFNMSATGEQWKRFTSIQRVITQRPGFDWEARIEVMPGLAARVHDAYIVGEGILQASMFGLISLANLRGTQEMARGELMRFFAEGAWYPTALLPSQGVLWKAINDSSAEATLRDGETAVTLLFRFDEHDLIKSVRAEARGRTVRATVIPTPWEGRWSKYERRDGMCIPTEGEVAWVLAEGLKTYWRGRITSLHYEFAK